MCFLSSSRFSNCSLGSSPIASRFPQLKPTSILLALALLTGIAFSGGCSSPISGIFSRTPQIYIPAGKCAEIREPVWVKTWSKDKDGNPIKSKYLAYAGSNVGPGIPSSATPPVKESSVTSSSSTK